MVSVQMELDNKLLIDIDFNGRILKANLSWTRKKSNSSEAKFFVCICIFPLCSKSWTSDI